MTSPSRPSVTRPSSRPSARSSAQRAAVARSSASFVAADRRRSRRRLLGINGFAAVVVLAMMGRATQLQVFERGALDARGERQRLRETTIRAERGDILDRFGAPLAMSIRDWRLVADPSLISNPSGTAKVVASALPPGAVDVATLTAQLSKLNRYVILANGINDGMKAAIEKTEVQGVFFEERFRRENPAGDLGRSVIGRVDTDHVGTSGLERLLNGTLTGRDGVLVSERSERGSQIPGGKRTLQPAVSGRSYITTIDRSLQYAVDGMTARAIADSGSNGGIVIVSDTSTGEILALSNMEVTENGEIRSTGRNTALVSVYEPGSVNKVITMAAALEERIVGPQSELTVPDHLQVGDHRFKDDVGHATMRWTIRDILVNSSNVGTIKVAQSLTKTKLDRYLRGFGLGAKTAIDFPGESGGILLPLNKWTSTSIGTVPIGQGLSVTAVQMLSVFNTLANGGVRMPMRLIRSSVDDRGVETPLPTKDAPFRVVSKSTAESVTSMLVDVVAKGTGAGAKVKGYNVAGKTGTARKPNVGRLGYKEGAYVASFAGYFPAEAPRLSIIAVLDEPQTSIYGGVVAAPLFAEVARWAGQHYRIPPSAGSKVVLSASPSVVISAEMRAVAKSGNWQGATIRRNALPAVSSIARAPRRASSELPQTNPADVLASNGSERPVTTPKPRPVAAPSATSAPTPRTAIAEQPPTTLAPRPATTTPEISTTPPTTTPPTPPPSVRVPDLSARERSAPRARATVAPTTAVAVAAVAPSSPASDSASEAGAAPAAVAVGAAVVQTVDAGNP